MGNSIHLPTVVSSLPPQAPAEQLWADPTLSDGHWREKLQPQMAAGYLGPCWYLEAPAWAVLSQDADIRGVGASANEAGQMLVLDIPHLRGEQGVGPGSCHFPPHPGVTRLSTPIPPHSAEPGSTYVLQLEQDLACQLNALAVEVLHGHKVALGRHRVMGAQWGTGCLAGRWVPIPALPYLVICRLGIDLELPLGGHQ